MKSLVEERVFEKLDDVVNYWNDVEYEGGNYGKLLKAFIDKHKNLGKMELVRLSKEVSKNDDGENMRDFSITCEPKMDNYNEYRLVLRHILYKKEKENGLHSNIKGIVFGSFELNEFDKIWNLYEERNKKEDNFIN